MQKIVVHGIEWKKSLPEVLGAFGFLSDVDHEVLNIDVLVPGLYPLFGPLDCPSRMPLSSCEKYGSFSRSARDDIPLGPQFHPISVERLDPQL